mmetsp:Transcript_67300/g.152259  ORF Transcript_67300/g.152259 Transcript_67300/m.152259 type:complete len:224 (-) Transcript_67300:1016-1687(-)
MNTFPPRFSFPRTPPGDSTNPVRLSRITGQQNRFITRQPATKRALVAISRRAQNTEKPRPPVSTSRARGCFLGACIFLGIRVSPARARCQVDAKGVWVAELVGGHAHVVDLERGGGRPQRARRGDRQVQVLVGDGDPQRAARARAHRHRQGLGLGRGVVGPARPQHHRVVHLGAVAGARLEGGAGPLDDDEDRGHLEGGQSELLPRVARRDEHLELRHGGRVP